MAMNKLGLVLLASILALPIAANAQIYKWKDKDGSVRYSDTPPPSNVPHQSLGVKSSTATKSSVDESPAKQALPTEDAEKEPGQETAEQLKAKQEAENLKIKEKNCSNAKANLYTYERGGRIARMNDKGEREFLDDAAMAKGIEEAKKEIAEFCN